MAYMNGALIPVPTDNREAYRTMAATAAAVFKDHGALRVIEGWGAEVPDGEVTSMPMAVKLAEGETVVMSWILWPSAEVAKTGMEGAMSDARFAEHMQNTPFDGRRLIYGGFDVIVDA